MHFPNLLHVIPEKWRKTAAWAALALLAAALLFNAFAGLGAAEIRNWDEARHAISAWEMLNGGNLLVNTFRFEPDYWNVKPVLAFWPSAAGFRLFGFNLFGMRFFQALALVLIAGISFEAVRRAAGWAAALVTLGFLTVNPAVFSHSFRNADADAAYMLFFMLFFWGLWWSWKRPWLLAAAAFAGGCAFLCKSFHVAVPGLIALVWVIVWFKRYNWKVLAASVAAGLLPILAWGAARYGADGTKFFETMVQLDLLGRVADTSAAEHGASPWYYYLRRMGRDLTLVPAVIVLLAGGVYALFFRWKAIREELRPLALLGWLGFLAPIAVYSIARVKLPWYIYPAFLPMAVLAGVLVRIWLEASPEAVRPQLAGRFRRGSAGAVVAALQAALVLAATVWSVAGEGKSIRRIVKLDRQRDVLLSAEQPGSFRGKRVYPVGPDGAFRLADATQLLTFYLAGAEPLAGGLEKFRQDASPEKLLVCVCPGEVSREWAEETGRRLGLRLIRFAGESALYGL